MPFLIPILAVAIALAAIALARTRRSRRRETRFVLGELKSLAAIAAEPARLTELAFTGPHRDDQDRVHDTMFTVRHDVAHRRLSFILDTSRWRIRWWVLAETFDAEGKRVLRHEATFTEGAIPTEPIRALLKAARGEMPEASKESVAETSPQAPPRPEHPPDPAVDPFETVSDPTAQAPSPTASATGD